MKNFESTQRPQAAVGRSTRRNAPSIGRVPRKLVHILAVKPTGSVFVYFLCKTFQSLIDFREMFKTGQLKHMLEIVFNCALAMPEVCISLTVSLDEKEYQRSVEEARRTSNSDQCFCRWINKIQLLFELTFMHFSDLKCYFIIQSRSNIYLNHLFISFSLLWRNFQRTRETMSRQSMTYF